jgi:glutamate 5-kinase
MSTYTKAFAAHGVTAAQVLLTHDDLGDRDRALCLLTTLTRLLELGTVPVLNENDSVSVRELVEHQRKEGLAAGEPPVFGDNDGLSAMVAAFLRADLLILLTNVDGVFTASPFVDPTATRIREIPAVDDEALARAAGTSNGGTGGMASKLEAARLAAAEGASIVVANGTVDGIIDRILAGEDVGTLIPPSEKRRARWRHIAISARAQGALVINTGALKALGEHKASLLPIGVVGVEGAFEKGDVVEIRDGSGRVHGRGLVNYDADACRRLAGHRSDEIDALLGAERSYDALITRDNLVMGAL